MTVIVNCILKSFMALFFQNVGIFQNLNSLKNNLFIFHIFFVSLQEEKESTNHAKYEEEIHSLQVN